MILNLNIKFYRDKAQSYLNKLIEQGAKIELKKIHCKRTCQQNKYIHVLFSIIAIELGYKKEEAKQLVKSQCDFMSYDKDGHKFIKSTADLDTKEMSEFIEWMQMFYAEQQIFLPSADDYMRDWAEIDNYIDQNKVYL